MKKIPVIRTVKAAYRFTFEHLGTIIGLIWMPMVLVTVIGFFVEQRYYSAAADALASNNYARLGPSVLSLFCYFVAALLLYAVMYVPVVQLAQGQRKDGVLMHFALGPQEWRMFRALAGFVAFLLLPVLIVGFLRDQLTLALPALHGLSPQLAMAALDLILALAYLGIAYIALRFVFLLPALAVSEEGPVLPRAWILSGGNFWRMVLIVLGTLGPIAVISLGAELMLEGRDAVIPGFANSTAMMAAQLHTISQNMPLSQGINFLIAPLVLGLGAGSSVASLAALKDAGNNVIDA